MSTFLVTLAVARGAIFDIGQRISVHVLAQSKIDAALQAEQLADAELGSDVEYSHATGVRCLGSAPAAILAMAVAA